MSEKYRFEDASPNPEYLIKSIAEQGYSLETSLADLIDNSISANADKIEILIDVDLTPFKLFLVDNGVGMTSDELRNNMRFPSDSPDNDRNESDLGRFGLGLKTASFSQTRKLTVLSKRKYEKEYHGRTWDVDFLKENGWKIIINSKEETAQLLDQYHKISKNYLNGFSEYEPSTIIIWDGLYKFENYLKEYNRKSALKKEITEVTAEYLSLVFHRFMENSKLPLRIRINNSILDPFNPFPVEEKDFRCIEPRQSKFKTDIIKMEGYVLPSRSITEAKRGINKWTTRHKGLMDMEGLYIYRADRIIFFGGWNGIIKKAPRLQLARMKVEVGNKVDKFLHLNVAKSQIKVPHELRAAFENYIGELKIEAEREFYNRGVRKFSGNKLDDHIQLFERSYSNRGALLELNTNFPLIESLEESLNTVQRGSFNLLLKMINTRINSIRHVHQEENFVGIEEVDRISADEIETTIIELLHLGITKGTIKEEILPNLGFTYDSLPNQIKELVK